MRSIDGAGRGIEVTRRCADLTELLAAAGAGLGRIGVVSGDLPGLDREAITQLRSCGVMVLALVDPGRPGERERIEALGAALVLDLVGPDQGGDGRPPGDLGVGVVEAVRRLLDTGEVAPDRRGNGASDGGRGSSSASLASVRTPGTDANCPSVTGRTVVIWGPTGAPGRTTLAVNLAAEIAALAGPVVLVDADTYGGTVAQLVGMLDEAPGLAAAARAAASGLLDVPTLTRLAPVLSPGLRVLSGISRADRWTELPASALDVVWGLLRTAVPWTVVDTGFCLERDEVLSYDTRAPIRNAATLSAIETADALVVVGGGDPIGIQRLVRALDEVGCLTHGARQVVVVNRVRAGTAGPRPGAAIRQALERYAGVREVVLVPDDAAVLDEALLSGRFLREVAPASSTRRAIESLAVALVAEDAEVATGRGAPRPPHRVRPRTGTGAIGRRSRA